MHTSTASDDFIIHLSKEARTYILYQRTKIDSKTIVGSIAAKIQKVLPFLYHPLVTLRAAAHGAWIDKRFNELINEDFRSIEAYLPQIDAPQIIDIGCGIAGIDVVLAAHYKHNAHFILVDKTQVDTKIHYGFEQEASFYNSLPLAKQILIENGTPASNITLLSPETFIATPLQADVVISLESWGFHYPLSTYMETVKQSLRKGGTLIVEVRKNSGEFEELQKHFADVRIISDAKRQRVVCLKD